MFLLGLRRCLIFLLLRRGRLRLFFLVRALARFLRLLLHRRGILLGLRSNGRGHRGAGGRLRHGGWHGRRRLHWGRRRHVGLVAGRQHRRRRAGLTSPHLSDGRRRRRLGVLGRQHRRGGGGVSRACLDGGDGIHGLDLLGLLVLEVVVVVIIVGIGLLRRGAFENLGEEVRELDGVRDAVRKLCVDGRKVDLPALHNARHFLSTDAVRAGEDGSLGDTLRLHKELNAPLHVAAHVRRGEGNVVAGLGLGDLAHLLEACKVPSAREQQQKTVVVVGGKEGLGSKIKLTDAHRKVANVLPLLRLVLPAGDLHGDAEVADLNGKLELVLIIVGHVHGKLFVALVIEELRDAAHQRLRDLREQRLRGVEVVGSDCCLELKQRNREGERNNGAFLVHEVDAVLLGDEAKKIGRALHNRDRVNVAGNVVVHAVRLVCEEEHVADPLTLAHALVQLLDDFEGKLQTVGRVVATTRRLNVVLNLVHVVA
eukprot:PhM_4_TR5174/c1_g1_i1/m.27074